jgi:hypothetical protein
MPLENLDLKLDDYKKGQIELVDFLELLPDDKDRAFELYLTKIVEEIPDIYNQLINVLSQSDSLHEKMVFSAFYGLCIYYRRMKEFTKLDNLMSKFEVRFESKPMYNHISALSLKSKGGNENIEQAIDKAKMSADLVEDNAGVFHNYADVIATAMEEEVILEPVHINDAIAYVKKSIALAPKYAKYYCTYGRLLALKGQIAKGLQLIKKAIDLEDSKKNDYAIRIGDYQAYRSRLIFMLYTSRLQIKIDKFETKIKSTKDEVSNLVHSSMIKNLEFLGFFAALVSFIIASIQILSKQPFEKATQLIIVLNGCLLCAFAGFFALINAQKYFFRILIVFLLGSAMIISSLLLIPKLI